MQPGLWLAETTFEVAWLAARIVPPHFLLTLRILPTLPDRQRIIIMLLVRFTKWVNRPSLINLKKTWQGFVKRLIFNRNSWIINLYCRFHAACWSYLRFLPVRGTRICALIITRCLRNQLLNRSPDIVITIPRSRMGNFWLHEGS